MRFSRLIGIIAAGLAVGCSGQVIAAGQPKTCVYQVKIKSSYGTEGLREMYIKGDNFRWDYHSGDNISGIKMETSVVKNRDGCFLVSKMTRQIGKYPPGDPRESPMSYILGPQGDINGFIKSQNAKKQKSEKVGKVLCNVYAYRVQTAAYKLYVNAKTGTPVQITITAPARKKTMHRTITYISYKVGVAVPDSRFVLPKDLPIRPMPKRP
jgi:outer membrane lipoprotein-sorting protein